MKIALVVFNGMTFLDFVGFYDVITRLRSYSETQDTTWDICGIQEEVSDEHGMTVKVTNVKPDLKEYDMVFVPGGMGTRTLQYDDEFMAWLKGAEQTKFKVAVCTGSLLLGAAGFLADKRATTHPFHYDLLAPYCKEVVKCRLVRDGHVITGGGVATSIDLGLYVLGLFIPDEEVQQIRKQMDYPYRQRDTVTA
ncbi:DJ-1/PfpI family protein [Neobacillus mesonae]|nr:DJ-1/PfpI family protein [Neobacillus mesonae]